MTREKVIKVIKEFINGTCLHLVDQEALETLIPELKESEDERIRKWILEKMQGYASSGIPCSDEIKMADKAIDYLEKQKEQKQEWSESDKQNINLIISYLDSYIKEHNDTFGADECKYLKYWLKSLSSNLKKKNEDVAKLCSNEWSEEDENVLKYLHELIGYGYVQRYMDAQTAHDMLAWVNEHFHPGTSQNGNSYWKPSEHQMTILKAVKDYVGVGSGYWGEALGSLIEDLEKL